MIEAIKLTWHAPKKWSGLPLYQLDADIIINGYRIPRGSFTDGGTIPWGFRNTFNPMGKGFPAFIAHDHKLKRDNYDRKQADKELYPREGTGPHPLT